MKLRLLLLAALGLLAFASTATAATPPCKPTQAHPCRAFVVRKVAVPMNYVCRFADKRAARQAAPIVRRGLRRGASMQTICAQLARRGLVGASVANKVKGSCGYAWIYIYGFTSQPGKVYEKFGLSLDSAIIYGYGSVPWWNLTNGWHNIYYWAFGSSFSGNVAQNRWTGKTGRGWVFAQLSAYALTVLGSCSTNPSQLPNSEAYAY